MNVIMLRVENVLITICFLKKLARSLSSDESSSVFWRVACSSAEKNWEITNGIENDFKHCSRLYERSVHLRSLTRLLVPFPAWIWILRKTNEFFSFSYRQNTRNVSVSVWGEKLWMLLSTKNHKFTALQSQSVAVGCLSSCGSHQMP